MADFMSRCSCDGSKPKQLANLPFFHRNALLLRMMRNRRCVRYLVAPPHFGKTLLAGSYAQLMFGFENTFWVGAQSPCFLRDIDDGSLADELLDHAAEPSLAVFDDVPILDEARRAEFWRTCEELLAKGWEVVAATTPAADPLINHRDSCIVIAPVDFLLDDIDFEELRSMDIDAHRLKPPLYRVDRIPGLARRKPGTYERFLATQIGETPYDFDTALLFCLLALEEGTFEDIAQALGRRIDVERFDMEDRQPYVRIDSFRHEFEAPGFPLHEVMRAFTPHMPRIAEAVGEADASALVARIADVLARRGETDRAAQLLMMLCEPAQRALWLEANQMRLALGGALTAPQAVYESLHHAREGKRTALVAGSAVRLCLLGREADGAKALDKMARREDLPLDERLRAVSCLLLLAPDSHCRAKPFERLLAALCREVDSVMSGRESHENALRFLWKTIAAGGGDLSAAAAVFPDADDAALALACLMRSTALWTSRRMNSGMLMASRDALAKSAASLFEHRSGNRSASMAEVLLKREMVRFDALDAALPVALRRAAWQRCEAMEASLQVQRASYARACEGAASKIAGGAPDIASELVGSGRGRARSSVVLQVQLFGGFDVKLGDTPVERSLLSRQKVRTLLTLLVLNCGKDLSCDRLCEMLWPDSSEEKARHNFYSIWSLLHKALSLPDGDCPYLIRTQGVCRIDARLVHSDAADIAELCRKLTYEKPDANQYLRLFDQVKEVYRGDLLPGERKTHVISAARMEWRNRLTESMIAASGNLEQIGRPSIALRFAQQALVLDPQREDAYRAVIGFQVACGLRPAAIETWLSYRRICSQELGLDPSPEMERFYHDIIQADPKDVGDGDDIDGSETMAQDE